MEKIVLTMKGVDNIKRKYILPTNDHYQINNLIKKYNLTDHKLMNWKVENIITL